MNSEIAFLHWTHKTVLNFFMTVHGSPWISWLRQKVNFLSLRKYNLGKILSACLVSWLLICAQWMFNGSDTKGWKVLNLFPYQNSLHFPLKMLLFVAFMLTQLMSGFSFWGCKQARNKDFMKLSCSIPKVVSALQLDMGCICNHVPAFSDIGMNPFWKAIGHIT